MNLGSISMWHENKQEENPSIEPSAITVKANHLLCIGEATVYSFCPFNETYSKNSTINNKDKDNYH